MMIAYCSYWKHGVSAVIASMDAHSSCILIMVNVLQSSTVPAGVQTCQRCLGVRHQSHPEAHVHMYIER